MKDRKKITINLTSRVEQMLDEICEITERSQTDAVQEAIRMLHFMIEETQAGRSIVTVDADKEDPRELYFKY
ncbi:MAG: hypothetical protein AAF962_03175 [Actinomycetota bacterium]